MRVDLLGPLELTDDGISIHLPGEKLRAIMATLALSPRMSVSSSELIDELWGERLTRNAANSLQSHVARLRRILAERSGKPQLRNLIETTHSGYVLRVDPDLVDAQRFSRIVAGLEGYRREPPQRIVELLTEGLALWRGPALLDAGHGMICRTAYVRLEETRLVALELLIDAKLEVGQSQIVVPEIEQLCLQHPLRERFCEQLMTALYLSGRQADALDVFHRTRHRLTNDLGLEPSPRLKRKFQQILNNAPTRT
ncbi:BTAD domain-containing putative transcriptional regulator [Kitasatospora griseola]|uniref:AfsR/SARP family transcriptional regulator n=1 Tax=Kitasatospora griseola TaxID=2064 RepID=UPI000695C38A|nr:AfsR/SARP family transcriptional regulator [Kitasatospora griseola]PJN22579.1 hypothetical protein CG736_26960 [Kitasatospora sp. CB02891]